MKQKLAQLLTVKSIVTMTWACIVSRSSSTCVKATYTRCVPGSSRCSSEMLSKALPERSRPVSSS